MYIHDHIDVDRIRCSYTLEAKHIFYSRDPESLKIIFLTTGYVNCTVLLYWSLKGIRIGYRKQCMCGLLVAGFEIKDSWQGGIENH